MRAAESLHPLRSSVRFRGGNSTGIDGSRRWKRERERKKKSRSVSVFGKCRSVETSSAGTWRMNQFGESWKGGGSGVGMGGRGGAPLGGMEEHPKSLTLRLRLLPSHKHAVWARPPPLHPTPTIPPLPPPSNPFSRIVGGLFLYKQPLFDGH